jgi:CRISPR-associated exonuclease Cas4
MKILDLEIHNYRSIRHLKMKCEPLVVMLGPNNHGKSNILLAIEFALSTSVKALDSDFFAFRGDDDQLWVEVTFEALTEQERTTFKKYIRGDGTLRVRKSARLIGPGAIEVGYNGWVQEPEEEWLRGDNARQLANRDEVNKTPLKDLAPSAGRITQAQIAEAQQSYIEQHRTELRFQEVLEATPFLGQKNIGGGVLPEFYMIPAVRDLVDETKVKNTTVFGKLLNRAIRDMADRDPRFRQVQEDLERLVKSLNQSDPPGDRPAPLLALEQSLRSELAEWGVNVEIEVVPPLVEKIFELGTNLHLDDGVRTLAEQKGHGLQRAVIFALFRAWANALRLPAGSAVSTSPRASSDSVVFAMEEPELFLHPHAQRRLARAIQDVSAAPEHQAFVCTHSTYFLDLDRYREIALVTKPSPEAGTVVRQCIEDLFEESTTAERKLRFHMAHWINPDRGEMFFAKRAVFVEGETERTVLPFLAEKLGCFDSEVSVVDCGSKHNLPLYIAVANAFGIPYVVIHDVDPIPDPVPQGCPPERLAEKRRTFELNEVIRNAVKDGPGIVETLSPDFEGASGVSRSQGERKGKALAALDYFHGKDATEIPDRIQRVVRTAFAGAAAVAATTS